MPDLTPDNIDALFRAGAERGQFTFREDAWDDLDQRLDRRAARRRVGYWSGAVLLLAMLGGALYWFALRNDEAFSASNAPAVAQRTAQEIPATPIADAKRNTTTTVDTPTSAELTPLTPAVDRETVAEEANRAENIATTIRSAPDSVASSSRAIAGKEQAGTDNGTVPPPVVAVGNHTSSQTDGALRNSMTDAENTATSSTSETAAASEGTKTHASWAALEMVPHRWTAVQAAKTQEQLDPLETSPLKKRDRGTFALTATGSVEMSGAGSPFRYQRRGYTVGVQAEYLFAKRFSVDAGFLYTRRQYTTEGDNYTARPGFWVDGIAPQMVDGDLSIYEIPVQFRFYPNGYRANGFFLGAGVSTYLVEREWYDFTYENPTDESMLGWGQEGVCRHVFDILNFTAGYQWRTTDRSMLRLAPYYNLPLTGIGDGKMSMQSAGVRLELSFLGR